MIAAMEIAKGLGDTQIANRLLKEYDYAQVVEDGVTWEVAKKGLKMLEVDELGLIGWIERYF